MGDRANVYVKDGNNQGVFLYTHWTGSELPATLQSALIRGKSRWNDGQYLARIIFCEMVKDDPMGTTGYGISSVVGDGADRILTVNPDTETVSTGGQSWSMEDYCNLDMGEPESYWKE